MLQNQNPFDVFDGPPATQPQTITIGHADPRGIARDARADAAAARAATVEAERVRIAQAEEERKAREWAATHNPDGSPKTKEETHPKSPDELAAVRAEALDKIKLARSLQQRSRDGWFTTGFGAPVASHFSGTPAYDVAKDTETLKNAGALTRIMEMARTNGGKNPLTPLSNSDFQALASSLANLDTGQSDEQFQANVQRVIDLYARAYEGAGGQDLERDLASGKAEQRADNEVPGAPNSAATKPPPPGGDNPWEVDPNSGIGASAASGKSRVVFDPRISSQVDSLISAGASKATVDAVLKRQGYPVVSPQEWNDIQTWRRRNPGKKYLGANISREEDLSLLQEAAGSSPGAAVSHFGNAATAGLLGAVAGPEGQGALDAMSAAHPGASLAGGIVGGSAAMYGAQAALAARAPAALVRYAPRIADTLYGGAYGFNSARDGEGLEGAGWGAGLGLLGGILGERVMGGVGNVARGVRDESVELLRSRGIPLTVGQTVGNSGRIGRGIKKIEDALTSIPFVGGMVDARRREGLQEFNRVAFRDAAPPGAEITATGAEGMAQVRRSVGDAYREALDPITIDANDPALIADLADTIAGARAIPNVNNAQDAALAGLQARVSGAVDPVNETISGRGFQEAYRGLARTGRERANSDYGHEVGQVMRQGQDALAGALERQNPGAFGAFVEANAANRRANVLAKALQNAGNQADELITPAQLNRADIGSTSRLTGAINSAAGNRPFYDLATAGQSVLPSRLADSGTATRVFVGRGAGGLLAGGVAGAGAGSMADGSNGAAAGAGLGFGTLLMLAAGGSRPAQRALTAALTARPQAAVRLGDLLLENARLGGAAGAATGTSLATQH